MEWKQLYLELVRRVDHGLLLFQSAGAGTQLAVLCVVESHAAVVVAELRSDHHRHIGRTPPRLRQVLKTQSKSFRN